MEFYTNSYGEELDKDKFITLQSLMKKNNGQWKSEKQAKFLLNRWTTKMELSECWIGWNVPDYQGKKYIIVDGYTSFSHGKGRGQVPIGYLYEVDEKGVVKRYRVRYSRTSHAGYSLKSVEEDWSRKELVK